MHPILLGKLSVWRTLSEGAGALGISVVAFTFTTEDIGVGITLATLVLGVVVWLVRLEGRLGTQTELLAKIDRRIDRIADHIGSVE